MTDSELLEIALNKLSLSFEQFICSCMDGDDNPKAPPRGDLMKARACLPPYCDKALSKKYKQTK